MKSKLYNLIAVIAIIIAFIAGGKTVVLAVDLSPDIPKGYDEPGKYPQGKVENVYYYSNETRSNRKLVVYTPPGYSPDKKYPVIYSVHGINNTPESIFAFWCVKANTLADNLIGQRKIQPVIIVAFDNNNINSHNELFNNVMPFVESHYPIIRDADHRGIYGYSMGGGVTFAEGMGNLDTFHHVCPTSATPFNHPSDRDMFTETAKRKIKTLVLSCGTIDWCGFYNANKASHDYCDSVGFNHYWLSVPGGNHDGDVWKPAMWYFLQLAFPADGVTPPKDQTTNGEVPGEIANLEEGWYYIKNINAEKYLQVKGNIAKSSTNIELRSKDKSEGQKWYLKKSQNGYVTLKSALGEFMVDVNGAENKDGANVQIYNGHSGDAQQFMIKTSNTNGEYVITSKCSNLTKVLDDYNRSKEEGTNVCQWSYNGQANQRWAFEPVKEEAKGETVKLADGWYKIKNVHADKYLQVKDNKGIPTSNVELSSLSDSEGQRWYLKNLDDGYITLTSALGEYMIDVSAAENKDGANIQIFDGFSGNAQQFMLKSSDTKGAYIIATKCSELTRVFDDANFSKADGANVCQWSYTGQTNQRWVFEEVK
ncbi:MAG: hypothetical protein E7214_13740 [Clostridium sp.]|nr:hypothetical protein [Clostridium sp.]